MDRFCRNCGKQLGEGDRVCGYCGTLLYEGSNMEQTNAFGSGGKKNNKVMKFIGVAVGLIAAALIIVNLSTKLATNFIGNEENAAKTEDGGDYVTNLDKDKEQQSNEVNKSDMFVMDHKRREGFMQIGESLTNVPEGFIGIYSEDDMQKLAENAAGKFILMADLDISGLAWNAEKFEGTLNGNYHIVSGLKTCLFKSFKGEIRNLGMENVNVKNAALVQEMMYGTIDNCYVTGRIEGNSALVSYIDPVNEAFIRIQNCYNVADIICDQRSSATAGIVGDVDLAQYYTGKVQISISNCENYGTITAESSAGGVVGGIQRAYMKSETSCNLFKCFNYGVVSGPGSVGGIIGYVNASNYNEGLLDDFNIMQCANYGEVSGCTEAGGICGNVRLEANQGYNFALAVNIEDCLNTAAVNLVSSGSDEIRESGGICGEVWLNYGTCSINRCLNIGNAKSECYSRSDVNNSMPVYVCNDYYSIKDMSISQMKDMRANLINFNYPNIWGIDELYYGFPHPYGSDEYENVMAYYNARNNEVVEEILKNTDERDIILNQRYADMLASVSLGGYWPDDEDRENYRPYLTEWSEDADSNYYAMTDIDHDGREELVIKSAYAEVFAYRYNLEDGKIEVKSLEKDDTNLEDIQWTVLRSENYGIYTKAYVTYYLEIVKKDTEADIGIVMAENNNEIEGLMNRLESEYDMVFDDMEEGYYYEGKYNGTDVFKIFTEDGGFFTYYNEQVQNLTLFGIYPGMSEKDARSKLTKYGFIKKHDSSTYATGDVYGNYFINITVENGFITEITFYIGSSYTG